EGTSQMRLPRGSTFKQVYEKGVKELQVQLTTYWDYITVEEFKRKCPDLMDDWSCNVVSRLAIVFIWGYVKYWIFVLVRADNRWMDTVPSDTPHPKDDALIQPYLVAYFKSNDSDIDKNKEWLKKYITNATKLKDGDSNESMMHLYCNDAQNCYMRSHNVGYRIRLGSVIYTWFRDQEYKSFVFQKKKYNAICKENGNKSNECVPLSIETLNHAELMKVLSKQLNIDFDEIYNRIVVKQALVAKAKINAIQNRAFYRRDESTNQTYFQLYLNSTERIQFHQFYQSNFPKFIQSIKRD
ncbi:hypothetical protein RFI_02762, partial [Reticulomyxa filosa]